MHQEDIYNDKKERRILDCKKIITEKKNIIVSKTYEYLMKELESSFNDRQER